MKEYFIIETNRSSKKIKMGIFSAKSLAQAYEIIENEGSYELFGGESIILAPEGLANLYMRLEAIMKGNHVNSKRKKQSRSNKA